MTGYGEAEGRVAGGTLRVELRSVNHRYFNLALKAPAELAPLEAEIRERLRRDIERGHLTVQARWAEPPPVSPGGTLRLNVARAREAMARLRELQTAVGLQGEITLELVARQPDVFTMAEQDASAIGWSEVEPIVGRAAAQCRERRRREGSVLARELAQRLDRVGQLAGSVEARAPDRLVRERERLRAQVAPLLDGKPVDETRLMQELAFVAERLDITEELVRLRAHLDACRDALAADRAVGKQLGFLAQELGREINTIGSKANDSAIQHAIVDMKGELERFREQLENLE